MEIKENKTYLAFSNMLLSITMLSNEFNNELEEDAYKIIKFIGNVFELTKQEISECRNLIRNDLTILSTNGDVIAFKENKGYKDFPAIEEFLYLKSEAILKMNKLYNQAKYTTYIESYFDYSYLRKYSSFIRFQELEDISLKGDIDINRTLGIMHFLGIGCKENIDKAIFKFKQCAYWGDIISLYFLTYLYLLKNDKKTSKLYFNLSKLSDFMLEGRTIIPNEIAEKFNDKILEEYKIISTIFLDIVLYLKSSNINQSFIEVILDDDLSFNRKMKLINNYSKEEWKKFSNPPLQSDTGNFFARKEGMKHE